jgi:mycofactocin precursor
MTKVKLSEGESRDAMTESEGEAKADPPHRAGPLEPADMEDLVTEVWIEDLSIDGMCGVY